MYLRLQQGQTTGHGKLMRLNGQSTPFTTTRRSSLCAIMKANRFSWMNMPIFTRIENWLLNILDLTPLFALSMTPMWN